MFIWWNSYTAKRFGQADRRIRCEQCGSEYVYTLQRQTFGQGLSLLSLDNMGAEARASNRASDKLDRELAHGVDARPCPQCGRFQHDMKAAARKARLPWLDFGMYGYFLVGWMVCAFVAIIVNGTYGATGPIIRWSLFYPSLVGLGVALALLPFARMILLWNYDPNCESPELRSKRGHQPGTPVSEYETSKEEEQRTLAQLKQRAASLLDGHHPGDVQEVADHKTILSRYVRGDMFFFEGTAETILRASVVRVRAKSLTAPEEYREYYRECARVFGGMFKEAFGYSCQRY